MAVDRNELVAVLKKVSPALSGKDLIPIFGCYCFTGETVYAYDDIVALQYPFEFPVTGGVKGSILLSWLSAARQKEVEVEQKDQQATFKAGRAKLNAPVLPDTDFIFKAPDLDKADERKLDATFLEALGKAALSLGRDPSNPWRLGVTVCLSETGTLFYASDNPTVSRVRIGKLVDDGSVKVVVLPPRFVELLRDISKSDPATKLYLTKKFAEAHFKSGLRLFTRTISQSDVKTFGQFFSEVPDDCVPVPKGLAKALERAQIIATTAKDNCTKLEIKEDRIYLRSASESGKANDIVPLEQNSGHPAATIEIVPEHLLRALPYADKLKVLGDRIVVRGKGFTFLVAPVRRGGAKNEAGGGGE